MANVYADVRTCARENFLSIVFFFTKRSPIIRQLFKKAVNRTSFVALFVAVLSIGVTLDNPAWSNPSGEKVVAGGLSFERDGNNLIITQGTNRAIVDWQDFSVRFGESTNFLQPNSASAILNRVVSSNPSEIFGNLNANGQVFLINQNGILVGESGVIDTNGFVASTLDVTNDAFMAGGSMSFIGDSDAAVINLGKVKGIDGDIILIARNIENNGELSSVNGTVALAAGSEVLLKASGDERILIKAGSTDASVTNSGLIEATNAELKAMGGNEFALAINNEGAVRATGTEERDGRIWLIAEKGTTQNTGELTATSGDKGGKIQVLGDRVSVKGDSVIDASGVNGGGEILIGGDFQGKNQDVKNAQRTFIGSDARISADATTNGDGGKVIVWADGDTRYQGDISVTGGSQSGDGGFVEVSGKENLAFRGTVDASAANGNGGSLLLDPKNIIVADGGGAVLADNDEFAENAGSDVTIDTAAIEALINADTAVTLQAHDNITISDAIISTGAGVMTFEAGRNITVDGTINTNNSNIFFYINDTNATPTVATVSAFTNNSLINAGTADVTISADNTATVDLVNISTGTINSQNLNLTHLETDQGGTITLEGVTITGNLTINASTGDVDVVNTTADGSIRVIGTTKITTAGDVDIQGSNTDLEDIGLIANNVTIYDKKALQIGASGFTSTISGNMNLDIVGPVGNTGVVNVTGRTYIKTTDGGFGIDESDIDLANFDNNFSEVIVDQDSSGRTAEFRDANDIIIGGTFGDDLAITTVAGSMRDFTQGEMDVLPDVAFTSGNSIDSSAVAPITARSGGNYTTLNAGNTGTITFDHANNDFDYLTVNNANNVVINDVDAIRLYGSTTQGDYTLDAGGSIELDQSDTFNIGGSMDLQNSAGLIEVESYVNLNVADDLTITSDSSTVTFQNDADVVITDGSINVDSAGAVYFSYDSDIDVNTTDTVNSGQFNITAGGDISQYQSDINRGSFKVEGKSTFTVTAATSDLLIQQAANDMEGTVTMSATGLGSYQDVNFRNIHNGVAVLSGLESAGTMRNVDLYFDNAPSLELPGMNLTGNLTVDVPSGLVTQADEIIVAGDAYFDVSSALDITLDDVDNDFNDIIFEQANDVVLVDTDDINFYAYYDVNTWRGTDITGNLTVTAGGNVTQTNNPYGIRVDGLASFTLGANDLILNNTSYNQWNQLQFVSANNVLLHTETDIQILTSTVGGTFELISGATSLDITQGGGATLTTTGNTTFRYFDNITLTNSGNSLGALYIDDNNSTSYAGTTSITEDDAITQYAAWETYYDSIVLETEDDQAITLTQAGNNFGNMTVTQTNSGAGVAGAVSINENNHITQGGAWTTHGDTTISTTNRSYDLTLTNTANVLGDLEISVDDVTLYENDTITDFAAWTTDLTILNAYALGVSGDGNIVLDEAGNVMGDLQLTAQDVTITENNAITDYGTQWNTPGTVILNAGTAAITLNDIDNILGDIDINGTPSSVTIYENHDITQSGAWDVGVAPVYLNCTNDDIILTQPGNVMGNITIYNTNGTPASVSITEDSTITQATEWDLGTTPVTLIAENDNTITLTDADNTFGNLIITGGDVSIREDGDITDGGAWTTTGTTTLNPGTTGATSIVLNEAGNVLGNIAISGDPDAVTIVENDSITQASAWSLASDPVTLTVADDNDIVLTQAANVFGDLNLTAGGTGNVSVTENDVITDGTAWTVGDTATLTAGANNITLDVSGSLGTLRIVTAADVDVESDIDTIQIDSATNATIEDVDGIDFNTSSVTTLLDVTAGGHITQTGGAIAAGNLRLVGTGYATLENVANDVDNLAVGFSGGNLSFVDTDDFAVATIGGTVGIGIGANEVSLRSVNNTLTGISDISNLTSALTINTGTALSLPSMIIGGSQTYTAGGSGITLNSGVQSTAAGDITFNSPVTLATDLTVQTKNATDSDIYFNDTVAGGTNILTVNADNGQITFEDAISGFGLVGDAQPVLNLTAGGTGTLVKSTVAANGGLTVTGPITFQDDVTLANGNSGSVFGGQVTLGKVGGMDFSGYDTVRFSGGVVLADGASTINSNNSLLTFENANTVDGAFALTLNSGTAEIVGLDHIGTNITSLTVTGDEITVPSAGLQVNGPISLTSTGGTSTFLEGDVETTAAGTITFNSPVELRASASVTSDGTVGDNINFESTVDGNYDLTVNSGAAITNFKGAVGSGSPLGDATGAALIVQNTGITNFDSTVETRSGITSTGSGAVVFDDDVTMGDGNTASSFTGAVTLGKGGGTQFSGYDGITFTGGANLTGGAIEVVSNGSTIAFGNTVSGAQNLTLTALSGGAGTVTGLDNVDTNLTALTIVAQTLSLPDGLTINGPMEFTAAGGITTNGALETTADGTGTITFNSAVALATGDNSITTVNSDVDFNDTLSGAQDLVISAGTGSRTFYGAVSNIGDGTGAAITLNNAGNVLFKSTVGTNSGLVINNSPFVIIEDSMTFGNGDTGSNFGGGGAFFMNGSGATKVISGFDGITFPTVSIDDGPVSIISNDSALLFSGTVTGNQNLTLNSGTSTTTFSSAVGGAVAGDAIGSGVGAAITTSGSGLTRFSSTLNTASGVVAAGPVQFDDDVTMADGNTGTNISGAVTMGNAGGLSFAAYDSVVFGSTVTLQSGSTSIDSNDGDVSVVGAVNGAQALAIDSGTGDLELQAASGGSTALTSIDLDGANITIDGVTTTGTQDVTGTNISLNGDLATTNSTITITGATTVDANLQIGTGAGAGDILFSGPTSTINGANDLTLAAGIGDVVLGGTAGGITPLSSIDISGNNLTLPLITTNPASAQTYNALNNITLNQSRTHSAAITYTADSDDDGNGDFILLDGVSLGVTNQALNINAADLDMQGSSTMSAGGGKITITAKGDNNIALGGVDGAGKMVITGDELQRISTSNELELKTTGAGDIVVTGITGTNSNNVSGKTTLNASATGDVDFTTTASTFNELELTATGGAINVGVNLNTADENMTFTTAATVSGASTIDSNGGDISFDSTLDVDNSLVLTTDGGNLTFSGNVGSTDTLTMNLTGGSVAGLDQLQSTLTGLTINSTSGVTLPAIEINGLQEYNTGLITAQGDLTGIGITFNNIVTIDGNNLEFNAKTGTLTFANNAAAAANNITLTGDKIEIDDAMTGTGDWTIQPFTTTRNIQFGGADNGGATLDLASDELARLPAAPSSLTIGRSNGTGTLTIADDLDYGSVPLNLRAGSIAQTGSLTAADPSLLANGGTIVLTNAANDLGAIAISGTPTAVTITDTTEITQDGAWVLGAANLTLDATGNNITLEQATNTFGAISLAGADASIFEAASTDLGASTLANLTMVSTDLILTSGTLTISGKGDFESRKDGGANITIANSSEIGEVSAASRNTADNADAGGNIFLSLAESATLDQITTTGMVTLTAANTKTFDQTGSSTLTAGNLLLLGAGGTHTLTAGTNTLSAIAANTGDIAVVEADGLQISSINGTDGIATTGGTSLNVSGAITQTQAIVAADLAITSTGAVTLADAGNDVDNLAASVASGSFSFRDSDGFVIDTVSSVTGIGVDSGNLLLQAGSAVTQNEAITSSGVKLIGSSYTLTNTDNAFTTLAASVGALNIVENSGFAIGTVDGTNGVTATGNLTLSSSGTVTQSQAITAAGLELLGTGTHTLTNAANDIDTLATNTGTVSIRDTDTFVIGTVNTAGATTTGDLTIQTNGELTQTAALTIGGDLDITTTHNAGDVTLNNTGATATVIGNSLIGGNYDLTATGDAVTQSAGTGLKVAGTTDVASASVSFGGTGNIFQGAVTTPARAELIAGGVITLGNINEAGDYAVTSVASADSFDAGAIVGNAVTLTNVANNVAGAISVTTDAPSITDAGDVQTGINQGVGTTIVINGTASFTAEDSTVGGSGIITLNNTGNEFGSLVLSGTTVSVTEDTGATVIQSVDASTSLTVVSAGTITQSGPIVVPTLTATSNGLINLSDVDNDVDSVALDASAVTGANVTFVDTDGFAVAGIAVDAADVSLTAGGSGNITQTVALTGVDNLTVTAGGSIDLDENAVNNEIVTLGTISAGTGVAIADSDGSLTMDGDITATTGDVLVRADGGNLILADTRIITVNGAGDIYLAAGVGANFTNNDSTPGTSALVLDTGRFIIYSDNNSAITKGGLTADEYMNRTYAANGPAWADANDAAGNRFYYSDQATLTFTAVDKVKTYGDANPAFTYEVTGYLTGDNAASSFTGAPSLATVADANSNVGTYTITITQNTVAPLKGYLVNFVDGDLTVDQATLTITADDDSKTYDGLAYSGGNGVSYSGFVLGQNNTALGGTLSYTGTSQSAINAGGYVITPQGLTSSNYDITFADGALTVNQAALTIDADDDSKTYDGLAYSDGNGVTYTGFVNSETSAVLGGTLSYAGTSQGATNAGGYVITPQGQTSGNYAITFTDGALTVNQAALTIDADDDSKTYDGLAYSGGNGVTYTGFVNSETSAVLGGTLSYAGTSQGATNVGGYVLTPQGLTSGNYNITFTNGALTVNQAALSVTADDDSKTYDGLAYSGGNGVTYSGFVNSETSAVLGGTLSYAGTSQGATNVGGYVLTPQGLTSGNYAITFNDGALAVNQAALTIDADDASKTYDGLAYSGGNGVTYTGFVNSETSAVLGGTLSYTGTSQGATDAGGYVITPQGQTSSNYNITFTNGALTVNQAALSVTADDDSKTYDGLAYSGGNGVTYSGFVNGETSAVLGGTLGYAGTSQGATNAGGYLITPQGQTSGNYAITFNDGALTVNQAALTIDADDDSKTYDGLAYSGGNGVTYTGFVNGETNAVLGGTLSYAGTSQGATNVGGYVLTPQGLTSGNYNITFTNGALTVNQAALSVTADDDSKTYDGLAYSGGNGVTYSGFVNSETSAVLGGTLSYAGTSQGATNVGGYVLTPQGLTSGNYAITFNDGALAVNQAALTIDADDASKTYDGLAYSGGNGVTYTGFVNGETNAVLGGTLSYTGTSQGATDAGGYVITPQGQTSSNYNITFTNGALTVNQAALSVTADADSKTYDGLAYSGGNGVTYSGFVNGETSAVLGGTLSYAGTSQGATNAGGYVITPQGQTSGNYAITFNDGALTVNQAALTVTADDDSKTYDGLAYSGGNGVTYTGFVNSETSAVLGGTLSYAGTSQGATNVGTYVLTPQGLTSGNYSISFVGGGLDVNKALLTYVANTANKEYGEANPAVSGNITGFVNSETIADLGGAVSWTTPATVSSDAGSYAINGSGYTSGNYDFAQHADNATALTITQAIITYTADVNSIIYGDADPALTGSVSGFKLGQDESVLGGTVDWVATSSATSNVGTYGINGTGYTSNNYTFVQAGSNATALTVAPATLTYTVDAASREYGEANPALTGTVTGLQNGELLTDVTDGTALWLSGATSSDNVGDYAVYGLGLTVVDSNYNVQITQAAANSTSLSITPAELTYFADSVSRQYGNDNPALTGSVSGFKNSETTADLTGTVAWSTPATIVSEEGDYAINGSGYSSLNYTFAQASANAAALTVLPTTIVVDGEEVTIIEDGGDWRLVNRGGNIEIMDTDNPGTESADIATANSMESDMQFPEVSMQATPGFQIEFDIEIDDQANIEQTGSSQQQQVIASVSSYDLETEEQNLGFGAYYTADHQNNPSADYGYVSNNGEGISPDDVIGEFIDDFAPSQNDDEEEEEEQ